MTNKPKIFETTINWVNPTDFLPNIDIQKNPIIICLIVISTPPYGDLIFTVFFDGTCFSRDPLGVNVIQDKIKYWSYLPEFE